MARKGKRREEEHVNHERWLITYSDLITLLLVFFIILFAMSKVDVSKYDILSRALQMQFRQADSLLPKNQGMTGKMTPAIQDESEKQTEDTQRHQEEKDKKEKELQDFKSKIETYVQENNLQNQISVADVPKGIAVTLNDVFLFDLGRADLKPPAFDILNRLATLLPTLNNAKVSIEGHTDNIPVNTGSIYRDNWGLSSERALSVLRYLTGKAGLSDKNFVAAGYADTMPKASNETPEGRAQNRRVEITILR